MRGCLTVNEQPAAAGGVGGADLVEGVDPQSRLRLAQLGGAQLLWRGPPLLNVCSRPMTRRALVLECTDRTPITNIIARASCVGYKGELLLD